MELIAAREGFPKQLRLLRGGQFQRVYARRQSVADGVLIVYGCENGLSYPRLGLSVSRKAGGAVRRNRWKRLIREAFRRSRGSLPAGVDLVVLPRRGAEPEAAGVRASLVALARRVERKLRRSANEESNNVRETGNESRRP